MRLDDPRRKLSYLTESLERIFSRDRTQENRKSQIEAHKRLGSSGADLNDKTALAAKGKGKGKGKKGKESNGKNGGGGGAGAGGPGVTKALEGLKFCRAFANGECKLSAEECKKQRGFSHLSKQQLTKMFGFDPFKGKPAKSGGQSGDEGTKQPNPKAKAKSKAKGKGKAKGMAAETGQTDEAHSAAAELQRLKSRQIACAAFQKGQCQKGDQCLFAHIDKDTSAEIKRANAAFKKRSASSERAST